VTVGQVREGAPGMAPHATPTTRAANSGRCWRAGKATAIDKGATAGSGERLGEGGFVVVVNAR
jgi:hypothetical protein